MKVNEDEYKHFAKCNAEKDQGVILDESFSFDIHIESCIINKEN